MRYASSLAVLLAVALAPGRADVVVNEIMYHAPNDLDDLQYVELHNTGDKAVELSGWTIKGAKHTFPAGAKIDAGGYLVVCKSLKEFKRAYGFDAAGEFKGTLSHSGEAVELLDAAGKKVDGVKYKTRAPWPVAPDGESSSLERVCPTAPGDVPENWAPSPLAPGTPRPMGTPGKKNAVHSATLPPVVSNVTPLPAHATPAQEIKVSADVRSAAGLKAVELLYRVAGSGSEKAEVALAMTKGAAGTYSATIPAQKAGQLVRFRVRAVDAAGAERFYPHPNEIRPALSIYVHDKFEPGKIPLGYVISAGPKEFREAQIDPGPAFGRPPFPDPPARGNSAFVYVDPKTAEPQLFDFVSLVPRSGGRKIKFHKDRTLGGMTTAALMYEYADRFPLAEHLANEVYRKAGVPCPRSDFVRTWVDGRPIGFQLLLEQPNKSFLRRNGFDASGNLYKAIWFGGSLVQRHEKKTHTHAGHEDLTDMMDKLLKAKGEEQWAFIKKTFDAEEMVNLYAARTVLSDWDGFFNNYFLYHDTGKTGKWVMFPWDQDKTWGFHDGIRGYEVFFDMPITFGMEGDRPPPGSGIWWRPGGDVSKPLLANATFRKHFLARTKELLETVYTEEAFGPVIKALGERLEDEVKYRAEVRREDPKRAVEHFRKNLDSLREHLTKRRAFLLKQDEIKKAGKFDPKELK
ncbi:MAG: CotH kinase family protein [Planctomycetes bacterium]|nr:CotH kinase family protein [Planctomycetota bacterium]